MISALFGPIKVNIKGQMRAQRVKHAMAEHKQSGFSVVGEWNEL
jgi:hypothetical protein